MDDNKKNNSEGKFSSRLRQVVSDTRSQRLKCLLDVISVATVQQGRLSQAMKAYRVQDRYEASIGGGVKVFGKSLVSGVIDQKQGDLTPRRASLFAGKLTPVPEDESEGNVFEADELDNDTFNKRNG